MSIRSLSQLRKLPLAFALGPRARLRVSGSDAARYLEDQLSNSLAALAPGRAIQALLLTPKGRLCARVYLWREEDAWILDAEPELAEALEARISKYIVADDVTVEMLPGFGPQWHVVAGEAPEPLAIACHRIGLSGWDTSTAPPQALLLAPEEVNFLRIIHGIPAWGRELNEETLPHEARLEIVAVDFQKGCYVGQETVSRMQSVGRPTRLLSGLRGNFPPQPGLELFDGETRAGIITSAIHHFELPETLALGYVNTRCSASSFTVRNAAGQAAGNATIHEFPQL